MAEFIGQAGRVASRGAARLPRLASAASAMLLALSLSAGAEQSFPRPGWAEKPNPFADPRARPGGGIVLFGSDFPKSYNYYLAFSVDAYAIFSQFYETLLQQDPETLDLQPGLADRWTVSDDGLVFTFHLDPNARWSDGRPLTAADVRWTYDQVTAPDSLTGPFQVMLGRLHPPDILDERTIRFRAKEVHWSNLDTLGQSLLVMPRHVFEGTPFNKINFNLPVVSGPYRLGTVKDGLLTTLERRPDWWRIGYPFSRGVNNFDKIVYRHFMELENGHEAFFKGEIDVMPYMTAQDWIQKSSRQVFRRNWIVRRKVYNYNPISLQVFAMNMRRPPFDDIRVRKALALALDRPRMNEQLMYNAYQLNTAIYQDLYDAEHPCPHPLTPFDLDAARKLLEEAGYRANPATGRMEKDGRPLAIKFLTTDRGFDRFLNIYREDLKRIGVTLDIEIKDWSAWQKTMDEFNFDMTRAAWTGSIHKDPEYHWHSREAGRASSQNISGFKNAEVDRLIEEQRGIFDVARRNDICRRIDRIVVAEQPYVLTWHQNYQRLWYWNKFGVPKTVLGKYADEWSIPYYWWHDEDAAAELEHARKNGLRMPAPPLDLRFDDAVRGGADAPAESGGR